MMYERNVMCSRYMNPRADRWPCGCYLKLTYGEWDEPNVWSIMTCGKPLTAEWCLRHSEQAAEYYRESRWICGCVKMPDPDRTCNTLLIKCGKPSYT